MIPFPALNAGTVRQQAPATFAAAVAAPDDPPWHSECRQLSRQDRAAHRIDKRTDQRGVKRRLRPTHQNVPASSTASP